MNQQINKNSMYLILYVFVINQKLTMFVKITEQSTLYKILDT